MDDNVSKRIGAAEVAGALRREIARGALATHDRLPPERVLARDYGVARGTVREALNQLSSEGLVEIRPGSGSYVALEAHDQPNAVVSNAGPLELIDARFALEPHICRLAVLRARQQDFEKMERLMERMEASEQDPIAFSIADMDFHTVLAQTTGNGLLIWIVSQISSVRNQEQWSRVLESTLNPEIIAEYNIQHRAVVEAIKRREPEPAAALMKEHLETARLSLTRAAAT
jgi:GntR family uxuAB operon transcriptional repressor